MQYKVTEKGILVKEDSFILSQTLECGQCFRQVEIGEEHYRIPVYGKVIELKKENNFIVFCHISEKEFKQLWAEYFDLNTDYDFIKTTLANKDEILKRAVEYAPGIHILKQEFFECLISFIISQNNRIPRIKKIIQNISQAYGEYIGQIEGKDYFSFPSAQSMEKASVEDFLALNAGFRAKYIVDAIKKALFEDMIYDMLQSLETKKLKQKLMTIQGVGPKVADCVMLFSFKRQEVFPIDVWVKRVMSHFYYNKEPASESQIQSLASEKFGAYGGFAQQYLFHYARMEKIGK